MNRSSLLGGRNALISSHATGAGVDANVHLVESLACAKYRDLLRDDQRAAKADLPDPLDETAAKEIIACLPPRPAEALAVPLWEARRWLGGAALGEVADLEGAAEADETMRPTAARVAGRAGIACRSACRG